MKAIIWDEASQGMQFEYGEIPAELQATAEEWRVNMVEAAAEASEELMDKYLKKAIFLKKISLLVYVLKLWLVKFNQCFVVQHSKTKVFNVCWTQ